MADPQGRLLSRNSRLRAQVVELQRKLAEVTLESETRRIAGDAMSAELVAQVGDADAARFLERVQVRIG